MNENVNSTPPAGSVDNWEQLFEAALLERDSSALEQRLQDAKDAIMDRLEDSFESFSVPESRLLLAALNTLSELQRVAKIEDMHQPARPQLFGHAS